MAKIPPPAEEPPMDILAEAEDRGLGNFHRLLTPRKRRPVRGGMGDATGYLYEFDGGVIYQNYLDPRVFVYPWDKVLRVYVGSTRNYTNGIYEGTTYSGTLITVGGGRLTLSGWFRDPSALSIGANKKRRGDEYEIFQFFSTAATTVSQARLPDALARLNRGEALEFGDIKISRAGLHTAEGVIPWNSITEVGLKQGIMRFKRADKYFAVSKQSVSQIPNLPLFYTLVDALRRNA